MAEKDSALLPASETRIVPNGVDLRRFVPTPEPAGQRVLFIGSFRHFPNILAFRFFAEQVWPRVLKRLAAAQFVAVAGPDPETYWKHYTSDPFLTGFTIHGFVADVVPLYEQTNLVVAPTLVSAGTNLKVLEAMAMKRAIVATPSGCQGLGLEHGVSAWVAADPEGLANGVCQLLEQDQERSALAQAASGVARDFDWTTVGRRQQVVWEELIGPSFRVRAGVSSDLPSIGRVQSLAPETMQWSPDGEFYVAESLVPQVEIVGFAVWREVTTGEWELLNIGVAPTFRRRGVASKLINRLMESGPESIFLEVRESNHAAQALYETHGFRPAGVRRNYYSAPVENAIVLRFQK